MYWQLEKNLLNTNISSRCFLNMANFGSLMAEIGLPVWGTPANFNWFCRLGFITPAMLLTGGLSNCTMFGRLLGWYTICTFLVAFAAWRNFAMCKIHFASKSCVLVYWKHYCTALQQRASAKLCGMVQGMELGTFAEGATYIRLGGHHVGHRPTFNACPWKNGPLKYNGVVFKILGKHH